LIRQAINPRINDMIEEFNGKLEEVA
jgi:hypothetical protein